MYFHLAEQLSLLILKRLRFLDYDGVLCEALSRGLFFVDREPRWSLAVAVGDIMQWTLMGSSPTRLLVLLTLIVTTGLGLSVASAQTSPQPTTSGYGQYYVEFRSRQACDYGHTFVVFGRVGETPGKKNVAGLSPKGDDPKMWLMGHYMPVPSDTGWTDGDLEDRYITSRYRVLLNKDQYDRVVAHIRELARTSGASRCTSAMPSSLTLQPSWDLRYRPQAGFIRGCL
jgi:hypothetical protein